MKVKALISKEEHAALPDALKDLYVEKDGKFSLDSDHEDVTPLKNTLNAVRAEKQDAVNKLKEFQKLGDPEKIAAAVAKVAGLEEQEAIAKGEFDKLTTQMKDRHAAEKLTLENTIKDKDKKIEKLLVDREIASVLSDPEVQGSIKVLLPHMKQRVKVIEENGELKAVVHDGKGTIVVQDGQGNPMTIKSLALEMRQDTEYAANFKSTARGGSGAAAGGGNGGSGSGAGKKQVSANDAAALTANMDAIAKGEVEVVSA